MSETSIRIFLCGDVMTGRGIDQILPHPSAPRIFEPYLTDARGYLKLAEQHAGEIPAPASFGYPWGEALDIWRERAPDLKIINLETSVTTSDKYWQGKGINYRMHPANIPVLGAAGIDACALANNHVLDWGYPGLEETLATLDGAGVKRAGAGRDRREAAAPARLAVPGKAQVLLFSYGLDSSGIPEEWGATPARAGVNLLPDLSERTLERVAAEIEAYNREGARVIASLHWGDNWGFEVAREERKFAHRLIEAAGVDIVYGHSSHHVKGVELYHGKLVLYGCGDFINDYEGIRGYQEFRGELSLMYFADLEAGSGALLRLTMVPTRMCRFRLQRASTEETGWLRDTLNREGKPFGSSVELAEDGSLQLRQPA